MKCNDGLLMYGYVTGNCVASSLDLVEVENYDAVVEATKVVCGHDGTKVDKPSLGNIYHKIDLQ